MWCKHTRTEYNALNSNIFTITSGGATCTIILYRQNITWYRRRRRWSVHIYFALVLCLGHYTPHTCSHRAPLILYNVCERTFVWLRDGGCCCCCRSATAEVVIYKFLYERDAKNDNGSIVAPPSSKPRAATHKMKTLWKCVYAKPAAKCRITVGWRSGIPNNTQV